MGLFHFLIVVQAIIAAALVGVILMQRSEGGGLGVGGSPSGLVSARGAADLLTRTTSILAGLFIALSITLAVVASNKGKPAEIDESFERASPAAAPAPADEVPLEGVDPVAGAAAVATQPAKDDATPAAAAPTQKAPAQQ